MHILKKDPEASDADYSFTPVPLKARKGFWPLLFVMVGFAFNSTGMASRRSVSVRLYGSARLYRKLYRHDL